MECGAEEINLVGHDDVGGVKANFRASRCRYIEQPGITDADTGKTPV
jgi:hypothetical protein